MGTVILNEITQEGSLETLEMRGEPHRDLGEECSRQKEQYVPEGPGAQACMGYLEYQGGNVSKANVWRVRADEARGAARRQIHRPRGPLFISASDVCLE